MRRFCLQKDQFDDRAVIMLSYATIEKTVSEVLLRGNVFVLTSKSNTIGKHECTAHRTFFTERKSTSTYLKI